MDNVFGADGTDIVFENVEIILRNCKKGELQFKVKAKERVTLENETSTRTMSTAAFQKGKSGGKVVTKITLEKSTRLNLYHFNSNTSKRFHS